MNLKIVFPVISIVLLQVTCAPPETTDAYIIMATYNLRQNNPNDGINAWPNRKEEVKDLIRFHEFDIFGAQEGFIGQINDLLELKGFAYTGSGRDDGKHAGEHSSIFYKKDRFVLLDSGDFWLRKNYDKPGLGWDATCCNRICSWGKFKDKKTSKIFFFFSVHFDHQGVTARKESARLMVKKIHDIARDAPVFCVGDFNATPDSDPIKTMKLSLFDSREISETEPYGPEGTASGFSVDTNLEKIIDYIFVNDHISVKKYGILTDHKNRNFPSDHLPVMIQAKIND
jgi:endonuclease/exonuclease/phosphatase family metal-dependent hydrolase